ncbi:MAG TPA: hypothetical protein VFZ37_10765 [Jiangellaceae bacterium]
MSPKFARPDPGDLPQMLAEAHEMYDGALAESAGRGKAAASLAINAAVRSSDCICVAELGYHSAAASHAAAIDVLSQTTDAEPLTEALSAALSLKSLYNYQHGPADESSVDDVIANARTLLDAADERVAAADLGDS